MQVYTIPDPQMGENTYLLIQDDDCLLVDPGSDDSLVLQKIYSLMVGKRLRGVLYTHCHFDHIRGGRFFDVTQYMSEADIKEMPLQSSRAMLMWGVSFKGPINLKPYEDKNMILGKFNFEVFNTPGHTEGGVCILVKTIFENKVLGGPVLFTGDTLFKGNYGRTDIGGDDQAMENSLKFLASLPSELVIFPGHGEESTIGNEKKWIDTL